MFITNSLGQRRCFKKGKIIQPTFIYKDVKERKSANPHIGYAGTKECLCFTMKKKSIIKIVAIISLLIG